MRVRAASWAMRRVRAGRDRRTQPEPSGTCGAKSSVMCAQVKWHRRCFRTAPVPLDVYPLGIALRLEEDSDAELYVTRRSISGSQRPEVLVVGLPYSVELVSVQVAYVEGERVGRGESFRKLYVEEVGRQAARAAVRAC